jgi:anti-sigma regulatory factor (Ser/Thr protein kinase)
MTSISIRVEGPDQTGEARRAAAVMALAVGLDETSAGKLAIIVTECANNLWKHAGGGEMVLTPIENGVEALALDRGPGMRDVERCFQDGYSTAGSSGTGLGAVRRLATEHDIYTVPEKGTALLARVLKTGTRKEPATVGGVSVPIRGESMCGDDYVFAKTPVGTAILVVDWLGHGPLAADCASAALEAFRETPGLAPPEMMREVHGALRGTRGAAVAIGNLDWARGELRYCGIGNIAGLIWNGSTSRHLLSHPGIVGHDVRNVKDLTYELGKNVLVLLYSDGVHTHWSLDQYLGLERRDPALIAGIIYRDHRRGRDDTTVVAARGPAAV